MFFSPIVWTGLLLPFAGTTLGSFMVYFMRGEMNRSVERSLQGFASGIMVAASIWSLLIPAMESASSMGRFSFLPAVIGVWLGVLFLLLLDHIIPHLHLKSDTPEGPKARLQKTTMMVLAVTLHNIPEGMAVGVVFAGWLSSSAGMTASAAMTLALGIALQNIPEGAIISMPLHSQGKSKGRAFLDGTLSGLVEPVGTVLTILFVSQVAPLLPYFLSFAAGAMLYVVIEELIPEMSSGEHSDLGAVFFTLGFTLMMLLDTALG